MRTDTRELAKSVHFSQENIVCENQPSSIEEVCGNESPLRSQPVARPRCALKLQDLRLAKHRGAGLHGDTQHACHEQRPVGAWPVVYGINSRLLKQIIRFACGLRVTKTSIHKTELCRIFSFSRIPFVSSHCHASGVVSPLRCAYTSLQGIVCGRTVPRSSSKRTEICSRPIVARAVGSVQLSLVDRRLNGLRRRAHSMTLEPRNIGGDLPFIRRKSAGGLCPR